MSKTATMPLSDYIQLYESLQHGLTTTEAYRALESIHQERYGCHKCTTYRSFLSMKSRYYRLHREQLRGNK